MDEYRIEVSSNIGNIKNENQDNFFANGIFRKKTNQNNSFKFTIQKYAVFGVFDGMSGEKDGDKASEIIAKLFYQQINYDDEKKIELIIRKLFQEANNCIRENVSGRVPSGTTATVVVVNNNSKCKIFHVGDSRAYLIKDEGMIKLTSDDTKAQFLVDLGVYNDISEGSIYENNILTNYVGIDCTDNELNISESSWMSLNVKDKILVCSDGLTNMCNEEEIYDIIRKNESDVSKKLNLLAVSRGGIDNVTTILLSRC